MSTQVLLQVAVIALVTMLTRFLPFLIFPSGRPLPKFISDLGAALPYAVMGMLVVYCLKDVTPLRFPYGLPELLAVAATAGIHLWKKNIAVSLLVGTAVYLILTRIVFAG